MPRAARSSPPAVSSQREGELRELTGIYERRGLPEDLAAAVARSLSEHDVLEAHARDELGLPEERRANPLQAAGASALSFAVGAAVPLIAIAVFGHSSRIAARVVVTLLALAGLGGLGARLGGAPVGRAVARVVFWGAIAMAVTSAIGALVGTAV